MNINLNRRERVFITGAAIFIVFFALFQLVVSPVFEKKNTLASELVAKRAVTAEMQKLRLEYQLLMGRIDSAQQQDANRPDNFSLFSFLERLAGASGIKDKITYMRPDSSVDEFSGLTISRVEMRLQDITTEDLASYLFQVEADENRVQVTRLTVTKSNEQEGPITVVMRVETVESS